MKLKNNKGITGVDVTVSIIILVLFTSLISSMFYNINIAKKAIDRKTNATYIAIQVIEAIKQLNYDEIPEGIDEATSTMTLSELNSKLSAKGIKEIELANGYTLEIVIENYKKLKNDKTLEDIIKSVTAKVNYTEREKAQSMEIIAVMVKETL